MEEEKFSRSFVLKTALIVMCVSVTVSLVLSMMVYRAYFSIAYSEYGDLVKIDKLIEKKYMGDYSEENLFEGACKGFVSNLGDKYAGYYSDEDLQMLMGGITSEYVGIGVTVSQNVDGNLSVIEVRSGSSAERAGILAGDIITYVDGVSVSGTGASQALNTIKTGESGTTVVLTVLRGGESFDVKAVREDLHEETVFYNMLDGAVAYIRISKFNTDTGDRFEDSLNTAVTDGAEKLVLDLRGNPGGEAHAAEKTADSLLDKCLMYYVLDKEGNRDEIYAEDGSVSLPLAILTNSLSGSASELVAGTLQDNGRGVVIGETTYGKGIVQEIFGISKNSALKITVAEYFMPSGTKVHNCGITPDYEVLPAEDLMVGNIYLDNQLKYAVDYLAGVTVE